MACAAEEARACDVLAPGTAYGLNYLAPKKKVGSGVLTEGQDWVELQREVTGVDGERRRGSGLAGVRRFGLSGGQINSRLSLG